MHNEYNKFVIYLQSLKGRVQSKGHLTFHFIYQLSLVRLRGLWYVSTFSIKKKHSNGCKSESNVNKVLTSYIMYENTKVPHKIKT